MMILLLVKYIITSLEARGLLNCLRLTNSVYWIINLVFILFPPITDDREILQIFARMELDGS